MPEIARAYILAKNESRNISRVIRSLIAVGIRTTVLDSGSTDGTPNLAEELGVEAQPFSYHNHCQAYNTISAWHGPGDFFLILDADMQVSPRLIEETLSLFERDPNLDAIRAPIEMYWDSKPLKYCSLCPPKAFAFRGGRSLFRPAGHGEQFVDNVRIASTSSTLIHDDQKPLELVLANQCRYAKDTVRRSMHGKIRFRDWLRLKTPIYMIGMPLFALFARRGIFAGKTGLVYVLDRLIAEAITYRTSLSHLARLDLERESEPS